MVQMQEQVCITIERLVQGRQKRVLIQSELSLPPFRVWPKGYPTPQRSPRPHSKLRAKLSAKLFYPLTLASRRQAIVLQHPELTVDGRGDRRRQGIPGRDAETAFRVPGAQPASNWDIAPDGKRFLFVTTANADPRRSPSC
jgi:hypothetical protein